MKRYNICRNNGICPLCNHKIKKEYDRWWHSMNGKGAECNDYKMNLVLGIDVMVA